MTLKKIGKNIYYDPACPLRPYAVNVSILGKRHSGSFVTEEEAIKSRDEFIKKMDEEVKSKHYKVKRLMVTKEKHIWENPMTKKFVMSITVTKTFNSMSEAMTMRNKLAKYSED